MHATDVRSRLSRILSGEGAPWPDGAVVACAQTEGVDMLLERSLRGTSGAVGDGYASLMVRARVQAAASMLRQAEIRRMGAALEQAGLPALLLKGNALSLWLYPEPHLRQSGDIDFCLRSDDERDRAEAVLTGLGYRFQGPQRPTHHEVAGRLLRDGRVIAEVDLHSRLVNSPLFAQRFAFDELWAAGAALDGSPSVRYLGPVHALLHAAMHRAVDLSNGSPDRLKWVYDFHLFASRLSSQQWDEAVTMAGERGLSGVLMRNLRDAAQLFGSTFPPGVMEGLAAGAARESLSPERLGDWWYVQRRNLAAIPGVVGKLRWLAHRALPTRAQLEALYGHEYSWLRLVGLRVRRGVVRLLGR